MKITKQREEDYMYTIYGLRTALEMKEEMVLMVFLKDAIANLREQVAYAQKGLEVVKEYFEVELPIDLSSLIDAINEYEAVADTDAEKIDKDVFKKAFHHAEEALELNKQVFEEGKKLFEQLNWQTFPERKVFVLLANKNAFHNLGMLNRKYDDFITVVAETEEYYRGYFWYGNFVNVYFKKSDVRALTAAEEEKELKKTK